MPALQAPFQNKPYKKNKKTESGRKVHSRLSLGCDDKMDTRYKREHKTITKKKSLERGLRVEALNWCRWPDSNRHGIATGGF